MLSVWSLTQQPTSLHGARQFQAESQVSPVALFAATRWELAALRRALPVDRRENIGGVRCLIGQRGNRPYWLIQTGVGPEAAKTAAQLILSRQPMALMISTGFAGALTPAAIGDVVIGTSACAGSYDRTWRQNTETVSCDRAGLRCVQSVAAQVGIAAHIGPVVSVSRVVYRAEDKEAISRMTGATALDMESAALALVAQERAVPFMVVRTVSDLVGEELPLDFNLFLKPVGWLRGVWQLVMHPSKLGGMNRLRQQSSLAADQLATVYSAFAGRGFGLSQTL